MRRSSVHATVRRAASVRYTARMRVSLHEERLAKALQVLLDSGATSVVDLGCGSGALLARLADQPQFEKIVGVDISGAALISAEQNLGDRLSRKDDRLSLLHGSITNEDPRLVGFDAAVLLEAI